MNSHIGVRSSLILLKTNCLSWLYLSTSPKQHTSIIKWKCSTFRSFLKELAAPKHLLIVCVFGRLLRPWHGEQGGLQYLKWEEGQGPWLIRSRKPPALRRSSPRLGSEQAQASQEGDAREPWKCSPCQRKAKERVRRLKPGSWLSTS